MKPTILIVEDDSDINGLMKKALERQGYECQQAFSGTEAFLLLQNSSFDLLILDLMLPGMTGDQLIEKIKPKGSVPIIVISAKGELESKIELLSLGADDYMTKPFEIEELVARVAVQLRKKEVHVPTQVLRYKEMTLNKDNVTITLAGKEINFTKNEFKILECLLQRPSKVFSKQDIYDSVWEDFYVGEDKTINVHISNIRQKIKKVTQEEYIETVWGMGFRLAK